MAIIRCSHKIGAILRIPDHFPDLKSVKIWAIYVKEQPDESRRKNRRRISLKKLSILSRNGQGGGPGRLPRRGGHL